MKTSITVKPLVVLMLLSIATNCSGKRPNQSAKILDSKEVHSKKMLDGKIWMTENLNIIIPGSYCQQDDTFNCIRYGRLYTWEVAMKSCEQLGDGWRLPTNGEWQTLVNAYGGIYGQSDDNGKSAYFSLLEGGNSEFNALLGGNREANGSYGRVDAHGFYWTSTESDTDQAWFYNFAKGSTLVNRHTGDKKRAASVRCIKVLKN